MNQKVETQRFHLFYNITLLLQYDRAEQPYKV